MLAGGQRLCDEWLFQLFGAAGVDDRSSPFEIRSFSLRYLLSFPFPLFSVLFRRRPHRYHHRRSHCHQHRHRRRLLFFSSSVYLI